MKKAENADGTLAERIQETIGEDSPYVVSSKLALQGVTVSPQAIYQWLKGGDVSERNLKALARAYGVAEAWLRYGKGEKNTISAPQRALLDLFEAMPPDTAQQSIDFIEYQLTRTNTTLVAGESSASYMRWITRIRNDIERKRREGNDPPADKD